MENVKPEPGEVLKKTFCPLDCPDSCGLVAAVLGEKVVSLGGDVEHSYTGGFICRKMRGYLKRVYGKQRILYPMRRVGRKGDGQFERISWEEALAYSAERLLAIKRHHGGEAILPYCYAGNMGHINRFAGFPLFHRLGTSRLDQTICAAAAGAGWQKHCGNLSGTPPENSEESDLILAWGINLRISNVHFFRYVRKARKRGAKFIVIDPYRNQTAADADEYIRVSPGGDTALALALIKMLVERGQLNRPFIEKHTAGFGELEDYLSVISFNGLERISGVAIEKIRWLADLLAETPKTFFRLGVGMTRNSRGGMTIRALTSLAAVLGLFEGGHGRGVLLFSNAFGAQKELITRPDLLEKPTRKINMIHLGYALTTLTPPVKGLIVYNSNPLSVAPDTSSVKRGLARDDLFTLVHEQVMTPTARFADIILPATTFLENHDLYTAYGHFYMGVAKPVIRPEGEAKSNFDFFQELAREMGYVEEVFFESCGQRIERYLHSFEGIPESMRLGAVLEGQLVHSTNSRPRGDALIARDMKYQFYVPGIPDEPPIACLTSAKEFDNPDLLTRFPLRLISPPHMDLLNSTFAEQYSYECGLLKIHPEAAAARKIEDGAYVTVKNHRGSCTRKAELTTDVGPELVVAEGIFWADGADAGVINCLTSQKEADMGGGATFHECLVEVTPASQHRGL